MVSTGAGLSNDLSGFVVLPVIGRRESSHRQGVSGALPPLRNEVVHDVAVDIGEAEVASLVAVGEPLVIDP